MRAARGETHDQPYQTSRLVALTALLLVITMLFPAKGLTAGSSDCSLPGIDDRCEAWLASPGGVNLLLDAGGARFFGIVSGQVIARTLSDGAMIWSTSIPGLRSPTMPAKAIVLSPDNSVLFAVGDGPPESTSSPSDRDVVVVALDASDGSVVWRSVISLPGIEGTERYASVDSGQRLAVSPDGQRLYVVGSTLLEDDLLRRKITESNILLASLESATGAQRWVTSCCDRFRPQFGAFIDITADGKTVLVGAHEPLGDHENAYLVAFRGSVPNSPTSEGKVLWTHRYQGPAGSAVLRGMEVDEGSLYFTARSLGLTATTASHPDQDLATVSLSVETGAVLWEDLYEGPARLATPISSNGTTHDPRDLAVDPKAGLVFVTGSSGIQDGSSSSMSVTIAYRTSTGERAWVARGHAPGGAEARELSLPISSQGNALAADMDSDRLFVAGAFVAPYRSAAGITAYRASTGEQLWVAQIPGPATRIPGAAATEVSVAPVAGKVVAASSDGWIALNSGTDGQEKRS